ncbi:MAG: hypothetical protein HXY30_19625 [Pseudorhodoplanes sp.]|nr:hypothetical protein [Pseudorhodoplanes sp.]
MSEDAPFPRDDPRPQPDAVDDYALVLMRLVESASADPVLMRSLIFELSRIKLQKEVYVRYPRPNSPEAQRHLAALDTAIERVEKVYARVGGPSRGSAPTIPFLADGSEPLHAADGGPDDFAPRVEDRPEPREPVAAHREPVAPQPMPKSDMVQSDVWQRARSWAAAAQILLLVVIAGGIFYLIVPTEMSRTPPARKAEMAAPAPASPPSPERPPAVAQAVPETDTPASILRGLVPTTYGVYAIVQGRLHRLGALSAGIPDERISIGPLLTGDSETVLPDGKVAFVVYRRDALSAMPERVKLRLIAKVMRSLTFSSGKARQGEVGNVWAIRGKSFELDASRFGQNKDMILLRPAREDFVLPPGRYALLLDDGAYDFLVDGVISDPSLCLESVQTVQGTVYSECQKS